MGLVVDTKSGFAYVWPKPGPGPTYAGFNRPEASKSTATAGDWKVDGSVKVNSRSEDQLATEFEAEEKKEKGDFDGAIADYTRLIEIDPKAAGMAGAYYDRGEAKQEKGDYAGAMADYDRALELDPTKMTGYICLLYTSRCV